ncbi:MAG: hypothetical protein HZB38_10390 [Planctomycetes bacterium]|nr:hypothetical protein [Planctomycetota bacterium]
MRCGKAAKLLTFGIILAAPAARSQSVPPDGAEAASTTSQPAAASQPAEPEPARSTGARGPVFHFDELTLDLSFEGEVRHRVVTQDYYSPFSRRWRQTDDLKRFEETIGLRGDGSIVDDRFARYEFMVRTGLFQESHDENRPGRDLSADPKGELLEYDVHATLFPAGKLTANIFASDLDDRVPRLFLPSLERRRERYGAELLYNDRILPMKLAFESNWEELLSPDERRIDDERRGEKRLDYEATWQPSDEQQLHLRYEYDDRHEEYSGTSTQYDTVRNYLTLDHVLQIGDDKRSRLETLARFQDESGDVARDVFEIAPRLRLQHDDTLSSHVGGQYLQESYEGREMRLYRGDVGVNKSFGKNFDTGLNFYGLDQDGESAAETVQWGGVATAGYHNESDLGKFSANVTYTHSWARSERYGREGTVIGEAVTLRDPIPAYLAQTDVRRFSILVTDADGRRTFLLGRDYTVLQIGRFTLIRRVLTGRIQNGETVRVSYRYRTDEGQELGRDRVDVRVQHEFPFGLTPYYAASIQDEEIDRTRFLPYQARDVNRHRAGLTLRGKKGSINGELEYNDDSIDPYKAAHVNADALLLDKAPHSVNGRANASYLRYDGAERLDPHETFLMDLGTTYRLLLGDGVEANVTGTYRYEDDSIYGITNGVDANAAVLWHLGKFTFSLELEYDLLDQPRSSDGDVVGWIKLKREIPIVGGSRP